MMKSIVVHSTMFMSSVMNLFHKLFYTQSAKMTLWSLREEENNKKEKVGTDERHPQSRYCYIHNNNNNGKVHGRIGTSFQRTKQRYSLSRRDFNNTLTRERRNCFSGSSWNTQKYGRTSEGKCSGQQILASGSPHEQLHMWFIHLAVIIASIICYRNSLHGDLVHDDLSAIKTNSDVTGQSSIWQIFLNDYWGQSMREQTSHKSYRPFTILTFRLNCLIHDLEPLGFHLFNVCLHIAVCMVYIKVCLEVVGASRLSTLIAATHFAVHPIHTEAVTGIVGRADSLASLFVLMSFLQYSRCQQGVNSRGLLLSIIFAYFSMLSKEHGITVLGINFCWDIYLNRKILVSYIFKSRRKHRHQKKLTNLFRRLFITALWGLIFVGFRVMMMQGSLPQFSDQDNPASFSKSKLTRFRTYAFLPVFNFWLLLAPLSLSYDWQMGSIPLVTSWNDIRNIISLAFYVILLSILLRVKKGMSCNSAVFGLTFLIIPFIPASNLFFRVGFVVAERVLYMPSLGYSLLVGVGAERVMNQQKSSVRLNLIKVIFLLILVLFAYKTWLRNQDWESRESLFTSGLRLLPHNAKMHYNFGNMQKDTGNTSLAVHHYQEALRLWPRYASAHNNLGTLLNDSSAAESHFQQALCINPLHAHALYNLANLKHREGKTEFGVQLMERSLEIEPKNTDALTNLAAMLADLGKVSRATDIHLHILQLEPDSPDHLNNYAAFLQKIGNVEEALQFYEEALLRDANHTVALLNTARLMKKLKLNDKAESLYQRVLLKDDDPQAKDGLGVLYLSTGRATQAEKLFREALDRLPNDPTLKLHLAQAQVHQRKYNEAEKVLVSVMEHSTRREVLHQLATLYNQLNRTTEAVRYVQLALRNCPPSDISCAPIHAFHGDLSKDLEDLDSAVRSYRTAVNILVDCCTGPAPAISSSIKTHVHLNLGAIYHVQGKFQDAWRHYNQALAQDPYNQVLLQNIEKLKKAESQTPPARTPTTCALTTHQLPANLTSPSPKGRHISAN